jgi:glycosyltransferase 2 family protein
MNTSPSTARKPVVLRFLSSGLFRATVSVLLLGYIAYRFQAGQILSNMWHADKLLLTGAVFVFMASGVLGATQWGLLLRFHGIVLKFSGTVARYFIGLFFNFILPGFVGGDVIRIYKTARISGLGTQSFSSTLADRVLGLLVLVLFSLGAFIFLPEGPSDKALPAAVFMFAVLMGFFVIFAWRPLGGLLAFLFGRFIPASFGEKISAVYLEMHVLTRSPVTLIRILFLSCLIQVTRIWVHFLCARAVGIELSFAYFALFVPVMEVVASLPVSFGGVGVREMMGVTLFATMGVPHETVLSYTLLAYTAGFTGSLPGAAAFMFRIGDRI